MKARRKKPQLTKVVHCKKEPFDVYIGRPSIWGNPFTVEEYGRGKALEKYKKWIENRPDLIAKAKHELHGKTLGCWCKPQHACHGGILAKIADEPGRLLLFGDRYWRNTKAIRRELLKYGPKKWRVIHGDNGYGKNGKALWGIPDRLAVRGADKLSGKIARELGFKVIVFSPDWDEYGPAAGPIRNRKMAVKGRPTEAICFHEDFSRSKGSRNMGEILDILFIPWKIIEK